MDACSALIDDCFYFSKVGCQQDQVCQVQTSQLICTIPTFPVALKILLSAVHKKSRLSDLNPRRGNTRGMGEDVEGQMHPTVVAPAPELGVGSVGG